MRDLSLETKPVSVACGQLLRQGHAPCRSIYCTLVEQKMDQFLEQRYAIKFCVKMGKNGAETLEMLRKAYGDGAMKQSQTFMWHKRFREGRESVNDDDRSGRPSTSQTDDSVQKVRQVLDKDRRLSVRMIAEECGIPKTIVHRILTEDLQMRKLDLAP